MLEPHQNDVDLDPALAPAPNTILRLIRSKIKKFIHFDAAPAPEGAPEPAPENK
jgi:hypothetical protein